RSVLGRRPTVAEQKVLLSGLAAHRKRYESDPEAARKLLAIGDAPAGKGAELAAFAAVAGTVLNLDEAVTRE
ncbi:MAG: hypothetical protein K2W96_19370, partial [Gemmataceae bacterium]|nr:hypothetical protein [Gemmataceae bacterium]